MVMVTASWQPDMPHWRGKVDDTKKWVVVRFPYALPAPDGEDPVRQVVTLLWANKYEGLADEATAEFRAVKDGEQFIADALRRMQLRGHDLWTQGLNTPTKEMLKAEGLL